MMSCDTNVLLHAFCPRSRFHSAAQAFLREQAENRDFVVCELVLTEFYVLLRNPAVVEKPLSAPQAVEACQTYRRNRNWRVIDYPGDLMHAVWEMASAPQFPRRRIYDARLAVTLLHHGVTQFATRNTKHFQDMGFRRVWDPLGTASQDNVP